MSQLAFVSIGTPEIIILLLLPLIYLLVVALFFRLILGIPTRNKLLKQQNLLLKEIALKNGVSADTISGIENSTK